MTKYVICTASQSVVYTQYGEPKGLGNLPPLLHKVEIKGGAGVWDRALGRTPQTITTPVTDEDATWLSENLAFKQTEERGFVKIVSKKPADPYDANAKKDMADDKAGKQMTKDDLPEDSPQPTAA